MKKFFTRKKLNFICSVSAIVLMWLVWITAYYCVGNRLIVPSFTDTASSFLNYLKSAEFYLGVFNSFLRTVAAFAVSFCLALVLASFAYLFDGFRAFMKPIMTFIRTLPTLAVILLILKFTYNNRSLSPIIVTFLVLFPMIYSEISASLSGVDNGLTEMADVYSIKRRDRMFKIFLPLIAPDILAQSGANISLGLKIMISAEVLANTANGLGGMMQLNNISGEIASLAALTLAAVVLGLCTELIFSQLERITYKWNRKG